jgi:hypothetical protein
VKRELEEDGVNNLNRVYYYRKDYNIVDKYSIEVDISNNIASSSTIAGRNTKVIKGVTKKVTKRFTIRVIKSFIEVIIIL